MKKIILIFTFLIFLSSCSTESEDFWQKYFNTSIVWTWVIDSWSNYVWYLEWKNNTTLGFKSPWKITNIYVEAGENVTKWQLLAELDWAEAKTWFISASNIIWNLQNLQDSTSDTFDSQIDATNNQILQLEKSLELAKINSFWASTWVDDINKISDSQIKTVENQISQAKIWLETAKENYQNTQNIFEENEKNIYTNSRNSIDSANILANSVFNFLDNTFWITEENKNKDIVYRNYLWAKNSSMKIELENIILLWMENFKELENNSKEDLTRLEIKENLENYYQFFNNDFNKILSLSYSVIENSVVSSVFPQSQINELKNQITNFQTQNQQVILTVSGNFMVWLKWSLDSIENISNEKKQTLDSLKNQIENSEKQIDILNQTLNTYKNESNSNINKATTWLNQANKQIEIIKSQILEAKSWLEALKNKKQSALLEVETQISQTKSSQNEAWVMIDNTKIVAPFSWVITDKLFDIWSVVWAWTPVVVISDDNIIKLEINVWYEVLSQINLWKQINVKVENYNDFLKFEITKIFPNIDKITKKTKIELTYNNSKNLIKLWTFAKAYIDNWNNKSQIIIPNNSIINKYIVPWVFVLEDWIAKYKKIKIIKMDENFSQVEWLELWQKIITDWKENIYDGENLLNN